MLFIGNKDSVFRIISTYCVMLFDHFSVLLLLDLSAAFDTTEHQILLSRLEIVFSIRSTALQRFRSYFLDRNQSVIVNNFPTSSFPLMFGVPQGSVLGPELFVFYTTPFKTS